MSLLPRNMAPSAITILGARMFPVSLPVDCSSTRPLASQSPTISPLTMMDWAATFAFTTPPAPTRRSRVMRISPSIWPSTSTSSSPDSSPTILILGPITQAEELGRAMGGAGAALGRGGGGGGSAGLVSGFPKSDMVPPGQAGGCERRTPRTPRSHLSRRRIEFVAANFAGPLRGPGGHESRPARGQGSFRLGSVADDGAGDGARTRDTELGKLVLYQLSYARPTRSPIMIGARPKAGQAHRRIRARTWSRRRSISDRV